MDPCLSPEQLQRLLEGQLDDRQRAAVEDHVQGCPACQQILEELTDARHQVPARAPRWRGPDPSGPEGSVVRWLRAQGPPQEENGTASAHEGDSALAAEAGAGAEPRRLPAIAGSQLLREISHGGLGVVYEAIELALGRRAALKLLPVQRATATAVARFRREARAAARLHHTNIVPVFGVGEDDGQLYYVMQFIEGESLDRVFERLARSVSPTGETRTELAGDPPPARASSTATSSPPTCCWTTPATSGSPTSGSPRRTPTATTSPTPATSSARCATWRRSASAARGTSAATSTRWA